MEIIREVIASAWVPALLIIFIVAVTAKGLKDFVSENPDSPTARYLTDNERLEKQTEDD